MSELFYEKEVTVNTRKYNLEAVSGRIRDYLRTNKIDDEKYLLSHVVHEPAFDMFTIYLTRDENYQIDEDFDDDDEWREFCTALANELKVRRVSVPYWYYPK